MKDLINKFIESDEIPTDIEIKQLADKWEKYICESNLTRGLECKKDFIMGSVVMFKRMEKFLNKNKPYGKHNTLKALLNDFVDEHYHAISNDIMYSKDFIGCYIKSINKTQKNNDYEN